MSSPIVREYASLLTEGALSPLCTDAYKYAMGICGYPTRQEAFALSFRTGGPLYLPFDFAAVVHALLPGQPRPQDLWFLHASGYSPSAAMLKALDTSPLVECSPEGTWVLPGEPFLTVRGPSFLLSWLEPLLIAFRYPMQVATSILLGNRDFTASCHDEMAIALLVARQMNVPITVRVDPYWESTVAARVDQILSVVPPYRVFDVGLRSASCMGQHHAMLEILANRGIRQTSNLASATAMGLRPVGTTGHEHQQRFGSDIEAFRAVRDRLGADPSYLFDTYNAMERGIPAILQSAQEVCHKFAIRFDSGDQRKQVQTLIEAGIENYKPTYIFMDGYDLDAVRNMESWTAEFKIPPHRVLYGIGSHFLPGQITRNATAMVYKLTMSNGVPCMKHTGSKSSLPGDLVVQYSRDGDTYVCQRGEVLDGVKVIPKPDGRLMSQRLMSPPPRLVVSPETERLRAQLV